MHKFFVALILVSVPVSTSALAHSGTEQDEKASAPDVQRLCRKLMDKAILPFWPASRKIVQSSLPPVATCWSATDNDYPLSVRRRPALIAQYGFWRFRNLVVKISTEKARAICR